MHKQIHRELMTNVREKEQEGILEKERSTIGSEHLYYNRRPLIEIDVAILVSVHDNMEYTSGWDYFEDGQYSRYRSTLNI